MDHGAGRVSLSLKNGHRTAIGGLWTDVGRVGGMSLRAQGFLVCYGMELQESRNPKGNLAFFFFF